MLGLGLLLGSCLALREAKRKGLGGDFVYQFIVRAVLAFIIAGRIGLYLPFTVGARSFTPPGFFFPISTLMRPGGVDGPKYLCALFPTPPGG